MAIILSAKNIIIKARNNEKSISKAFSEQTEDKFLDSSKENLIINSMKKIVSYGNK